ATGIVAAPGERGLEIAIVALRSLLGGSRTTRSAGGGIALAARLLVLRQPEPERAEEDRHAPPPGSADQPPVPSRETPPCRGRGWVALPALACGGLIRRSRHLVPGPHRIGRRSLQSVVLLLPGRWLHLVLLGLVLAQLRQERIHPALGIAHPVGGRRGRGPPP